MQVEHDSPVRTLFFDRALLPGGWAKDVRLSIRSGTFSSIDADCTPRPGEERQSCALPGMPNLHSHAFQRAMAGMAEHRGPAGNSFWTWREIMYRFLDRMNPDDVRAVAALAYMEMLEGGFTRVGEFHYLHHDQDGQRYAAIAEMSGAIIAAAADSGIGMTLLPVLYSHSGFGAQPPIQGQRRFLNDMDQFARLLNEARRIAEALPDAIVGVAPHSLRAVSAEQLASLGDMQPHGPIHIHIAEQMKEVDDCLAWSGKRPVEWLLSHADVDEHWCLVHATHLTAKETLSLAQSGAVAGLCPITEANLGDGLFPALDYVAAGGRYGIGSDSNVLIDATEELRLLEYGQRLTLRGRNIMAEGAGQSTGASLYQHALSGGSAALGVKAGIAPGAAADLVSLDMEHPSLLGKADAMLDAFIFASGRTAIDCVWRRGERVVTGGRHVKREAILRAYSVTLQKLIA
ncbi:formimidoylglutamate deiminase [Sphingobium sp. JS3065]|uniref:formimidoylglutamate deiminase n=1 Tax=Sphingobium sp. JS3065 TaxID=2970925 RepID=UPI002264B270|nr:formimidoylglutamate deiminase [Sphingobium sp. JS3065]UZW57447.1 formimidoylglutamate deiminase [Sphingobium sp. JS3065]